MRRPGSLWTPDGRLHRLHQAQVLMRIYLSQPEVLNVCCLTCAWLVGLHRINTLTCKRNKKTWKRKKKGEPEEENIHFHLQCPCWCRQLFNPAEGPRQQCTGQLRCHWLCLTYHLVFIWTVSAKMRPEQFWLASSELNVVLQQRWCSEELFGLSQVT